jgi:hypothetical protein
MDRIGESSLMGAISSISATSLPDVARKLTATFWMGSSNGPDTTLYPNKVESNSAVGSKEENSHPDMQKFEIEAHSRLSQSTAPFCSEEFKQRST